MGWSLFKPRPHLLPPTVWERSRGAPFLRHAHPPIGSPPLNLGSRGRGVPGFWGGPISCNWDAEVEGPLERSLKVSVRAIPSPLRSFKENRAGLEGAEKLTSLSPAPVLRGS